jgi:hypothetical protein
VAAILITQPLKATQQPQEDFGIENSKYQIKKIELSTLVTNGI